MPFAKYLQQHSNDEQEAPIDDNVQIQFQIPSFVYSSGPPILALGGGAEVLPFNSTWFTNSGFSQPPVPSPQSLPINAINAAPSPLGYPIYSASGFDVLSILARVASRPNPRVTLGPVDMTCSFAIVDIRRYDHPIVYCSPTFCRLTGYQEHEILGRNCRFLQAPGGAVKRGEARRFTSQDSVNSLYKSLSADKEVQTSILNYRKDGSAFINLVSVIPILGGVDGAPHEADKVVYHVGFQVDLSEQPGTILEKLRDGAYARTNSNNLRPFPPLLPSFHNEPTPPSHRKVYVVPNLLMSSTLTSLVKSTSFLRSLPISTSTNSLASTSGSAPHSGPSNNPLSLLLLEYSPDFVHVVSLKGAFLYVAPSITHVLGYLPSELVGKSMADLAHPEDVVPLERQLKESSVLLHTSSTSSGLCLSADEHLPPAHTQTSSHAHAHARIIDVLFRARTKSGVYVWVECRGRLHVEPGKGRKAIILSARARAMPKISWGDIMRGSGGLVSSDPQEVRDSGGGGGGTELAKSPEGAGQMEFWAMLSGKGRSAGALVGIEASARNVLGYSSEELMGRRIVTLMTGREGVDKLQEALAEEGAYVGNRKGKGKESPVEDDEDVKTTTVWCQLRTKSGGVVSVVMVLYRSGRGKLDPELKIAPAPILLQVRLRLDSSSAPITSTPNPVVHPLDANIFGELEVSRGSSWQYELQQLRFANRRLKEEVDALEAETVARAAKDFQQQLFGTPLLSSTVPQSSDTPSSGTLSSTDHSRFSDLTTASTASLSPLGGSSVFQDLSSMASLGNMNSNHANTSMTMNDYLASQSRSMAEREIGLNVDIPERGLGEGMVMPTARVVSGTTGAAPSSRPYRPLPHRLQTPIVDFSHQKQSQQQQLQRLPQHQHQPAQTSPQQQVYAPVPLSANAPQRGGHSSLIHAMTQHWDMPQQLQSNATISSSSSEALHTARQDQYYTQYSPADVQSRIQPPVLPPPPSRSRLVPRDWVPPSVSLSNAGVKRRLGQ